MTLDTFVTWSLVGLLTGLLAGIVKRSGWYGLVSDLSLGLSGSGAASWIAWALGFPSSSGTLTTAAIAFIGAALIFAAEGRGWYGLAIPASSEDLRRGQSTTSHRDQTHHRVEFVEGPGRLTPPGQWLYSCLLPLEDHRSGVADPLAGRRGRAAHEGRRTRGG